MQHNTPATNPDSSNSNNLSSECIPRSAADTAISSTSQTHIDTCESPRNLTGHRLVGIDVLSDEMPCFEEFNELGRALFYREFTEILMEEAIAEAFLADMVGRSEGDCERMPTCDGYEPVYKRLQEILKLRTEYFSSLYKLIQNIVDHPTPQNINDEYTQVIEQLCFSPKPFRAMVATLTKQVERCLELSNAQHDEVGKLLTCSAEAWQDISIQIGSTMESCIPEIATSYSRSIVEFCRLNRITINADLLEHMVDAGSAWSAASIELITLSELNIGGSRKKNIRSWLLIPEQERTGLIRALLGRDIAPSYKTNDIQELTGWLRERLEHEDLLVLSRMAVVPMCLEWAAPRLPPEYLATVEQNTVVTCIVAATARKKLIDALGALMAECPEIPQLPLNHLSKFSTRNQPRWVAYFLHAEEQRVAHGVTPSASDWDYSQDCKDILMSSFGWTEIPETPAIANVLSAWHNYSASTAMGIVLWTNFRDRPSDDFRVEYQLDPAEEQGELISKSTALCQSVYRPTPTLDTLKHGAVSIPVDEQTISDILKKGYGIGVYHGDTLLAYCLFYLNNHSVCEANPSALYVQMIQRNFDSPIDFPAHKLLSAVHCIALLSGKDKIIADADVMNAASLEFHLKNNFTFEHYIDDGKKKPGTWVRMSKGLYQSPKPDEGTLRSALTSTLFRHLCNGTFTIGGSIESRNELLNALLARRSKQTMAVRENVMDMLVARPFAAMPSDMDKHKNKCYALLVAQRHPKGFGNASALREDHRIPVGLELVITEVDAKLSEYNITAALKERAKHAQKLTSRLLSAYTVTMDPRVEKYLPELPRWELANIARSYWELSGIPPVMYLNGGGQQALDEAQSWVFEHLCPIVIAKGSGGAADSFLENIDVEQCLEQAIARIQRLSIEDRFAHYFKSKETLPSGVEQEEFLAKQARLFVDQHKSLVMEIDSYSGALMNQLYEKQQMIVANTSWWANYLPA
jgi:hypothetical protein